MKGLTKIIAAMMVLALAACQSAPDGAQGQAQQFTRAPAPTASQAEQLAWALSQASMADRQGDDEALAQMLSRIDALGARPQGATDAAMLAAWQKKVAPDAPPMRGRLHGPGFRSGWIDAGSVIMVEQTFLAGQRASIAVEAAQGPNVALSVATRDDPAVCTRTARRNVCRWMPVFTSPYKIELSNEGRQRSYYYLVIE